MDRMDHRSNKNSETPEMGPMGSLAIVVRAPISLMPGIVSMVEAVHGARVVYQRTSAGRLRIVPDEER